MLLADSSEYVRGLSYMVGDADGEGLVSCYTSDHLQIAPLRSPKKRRAPSLRLYGCDHRYIPMTPKWENVAS